MGLWPTHGDESRCHPARSGGSQFRSEANQGRFFASLRMTDSRESAAGNLALVPSATPHLDRQGDIPRCARNDTGDTAKNP